MLKRGRGHIVNMSSDAARKVLIIALDYALFGIKTY